MHGGGRAEGSYPAVFRVGFWLIYLEGMGGRSHPAVLGVIPGRLRGLYAIPGIEPRSVLGRLYARQMPY